MYEKIPIAGMNNEEWLTLRKTGIGGSDAGSICGVNPFGSPMKVYHDPAAELRRLTARQSVRGMTLKVTLHSVSWRQQD